MKLRDPLIVAAMISAIAPISAVAINRFDPPPQRPPVVQTADPGAVSTSDVCMTIDGQVLRFLRAHPSLRRLYARPGDAATLGLPPLATRQEIAACGNPERLIEHLPPPPTSSQ